MFPMLRDNGAPKIVMMTGDSERTAEASQLKSALMNIILKFFRKIRRNLWKKK